MGAILSILDCLTRLMRPYTPIDRIEKYKAKKLHFKCRNNDPNRVVNYQSKMDKEKGELVARAIVPDNYVSFSIEWPQYAPNEYTSPKYLSKDKPPYADPQDLSGIKFNQIDGKTDRRSHMGQYKFDKNTGRPLNPVGRTGITGRGQLGKWGPNHAADPIVTRWKRNEKDKKVTDSISGKPILQFVSICRHDTKEWAIPGGMCDPGEKVSQTLKREFMEEATNSIGSSEEVKEKVSKQLDLVFKDGIEIYKGYVDDPRNTDNAWMETIAYNFHDEDNLVFKDFKLTAGDDAAHVTWMDINHEIKLYASHADFIKSVVELHNAAW